MKQLRLLGVYEYALLTVLLLITIHAPLTVAVGTMIPAIAEPVKAWKEVLLAVTGIIGIVLITQNKLWSLLLKNKFLLLALLLVDLHLLSALVMFGGTTRTIAGLMIDLRFIAMFMLMYVLITLRPEALRRVIQVAVVGAGIVIAFGLLQILILPDNILSYIGYSNTTIAPFITIDSNPDFVRINSTLRGPNPLGALMVIYIGLGVAYLMRHTIKKNVVSYRYLAGTLSSFAVMLASFSRSAYIAAAATVGLAVVVGQKLSRRTYYLIGAMIITISAGLLLVSSTDWFSNVVLHEDPQSTVPQKSNAGHLGSLADGAKRMMSQPFGEGVGSTGSASMYDDATSNDIIIENYYLFVAHEAGWLGALTFIALFVMILRELYVRRSNWIALGLGASGIGLAIAAFLLPVWADDTVAIVWWGLSGAAIAVPRGIIKGRHATKSNQKATRTS